MSVCCHVMCCAKMAEPTVMPYWGLTLASPRNCVIDGVQIPHGNGHFWGECAGHCNVPTHECIALLFTSHHGLMCLLSPRSRRMRLLPREVIRWQCGRLPNHFGKITLDTCLHICHCSHWKASRVTCVETLLWFYIHSCAMAVRL